MNIDRIESQNKALRAALILAVALILTTAICLLSDVPVEALPTILPAAILSYLTGYMAKDTE